MQVFDSVGKSGFRLASLWVGVVVVLIVSIGVRARPTVVGQTTMARAATLDGQAIIPPATVFSGDTLKVGD